MSKIYVTGHRNPDTDAIVAAMSYASLRQSLGQREYTAARIGAINDETQRLLDRFGFEPPVLIKNMRTQVSDLEFDRPPILTSSVSLDLAWRTINEGKYNSVPIAREDGTLFGVLSTGNIADYNMQTINFNRIDDLPLFNVLSVLEGTLVNEYHVSSTTISGELFITLPQNYDDQALTNTDSVLICGNQPEIVDQAIQSRINCVILCRADLKPEWAECDTGTCIISTPLSAHSVSRMI